MVELPRWNVIIAPEAVKRLTRISNPDRRRLLSAIDALYSYPAELRVPSTLIFNAFSV